MIPRLGRQFESPLNLYTEFLLELQMHGFQGEVQQDEGSRTVFSTDNSIYQVLPQAVVFPKNYEDVQRIMRLAAQPRFQSICFGPRGGGTGTNGQSLTNGVVIDLSRHLNQILEINVEQRWARVQAGVVKDQLNAAIEAHGLFFAPELSTSNRATIGGMVNTDASGQGSCLYGKTRDHVLALETVFLDGSQWRSVPLAEPEFTAVTQRQDLIGRAHQLLKNIHDRHADAIQATFPVLNRCLTGYDLAHIKNAAGQYDLNSLLCGSEGTLGMVVEVTLNLLPIPAYSALINIQYNSFDAALRDVPNLLNWQAASIETVDTTILNLAKTDIIWNDIQHYFKGPEKSSNQSAETLNGLNLVELIADTEAELTQKIRVVTEQLVLGVQGRIAYSETKTPKDIAAIWSMRKRAVGLLGKLSGARKPIPFVEDTAVPPDQLADYIAEFRAVLDRYGLTYGMFGHADAGVLHVRPALNMQSEADEKLVRSITDQIVALTQKYKGLLWGEHGKGLRSEYAQSVFGDLYPLIELVKRTFDPYDQLNPGKIASAGTHPILKIDQVKTRGQIDKVIPLHIQHSYADALHCNGNGACYDYDLDSPMCPSWKVTRDRRHSPKGRASMMREWLRRLALTNGQKFSNSNQPLSLIQKLYHAVLKSTGQYDFSHEVKAVMDGCLGCKSCVGQCPVKVDIPTLRAKFLNQYHQRYLRPLKDYLVAALEFALPAMHRVPRLMNLLSGNPLSQFILRRCGLVDIPALAMIDLKHALRERQIRLATVEVLDQLTPSEKEKAVVLVQDAFTSYYETSLVLDCVDLIKKLGYQPYLARYLPNGKPLHVHGFLAWFKSVATKNLSQLNALSATGVALVGIDPSMTLTYRNEYPHELAEQKLPTVLLIQEWLGKQLKNIPKQHIGGGYEFIPHCSERTGVAESLPFWTAIYAHFGIQLTVLQAGCCGMAGTYGHELKNVDHSIQLYHMSWAKHVNNNPQLLATGYSCRCQVKRIEKIEIKHPIQILLAKLSCSE